MAISIGDALLKLGVDKTGLESGMKEAERSVQVSMKSIQQGLMVAGAAFTAVGVAGMKMVGDAKRMNAELGQTALTLGVSTKEMRTLALATTDVTFPLKSVANTFGLLARAGITNTEEMQKAAKAFDGLADATGSSAEVMADLLLPAFKLFGEAVPTTTQELDKFTWMTKNTLVDMSDFGTLLTRMAPYMDDLNMSMDDAIATLAALGEQGIVGTAATLKLRTAITQAASGTVTLNEALGLTQEEIDGFKKQMSDATGITEKYAAVANTQFTIIDKLKQKISEFSLSVGSTLEPLEGMFGAMTALGPAMIGVSMMLPKIITLFKSLPMIFRAVQLAATSMWGAITLGVSLAIAAGIALWQNWDKVKDFMGKAWTEIKLFFLQGVENILSSLEKFTSFIPWLGDKVSEAREKISNMIEAEKVKKDLREVEEALAETTEIIKEHTEATEVDTESLIANTEALVEQKDELIDKIEKTRKEFEYERSAAGKLRISIKDVTYALFEMGWTNTQVKETLSKLGDEANDVNAVLKAIGITAEQVNSILGRQVDAIDKTTEAYKKQASVAIDAVSAQRAIWEAAGKSASEIQREEELWKPPSVTSFATKQYAEEYINLHAGKDAKQQMIEEYKLVYGEEPPSYQYGGPILEDTLLFGLKSLKPYAVAHEGENIVPKGKQMMTIILEQDGRQLARQVMPYVVGEVRLKGGIRSN